VADLLKATVLHAINTQMSFSATSTSGSTAIAIQPVWAVLTVLAATLS
jgi:hypothetical protein